MCSNEGVFSAWPQSNDIIFTHSLNLGYNYRIVPHRICFHIIVCKWTFINESLQKYFSDHVNYEYIRTYGEKHLRWIILDNSEFLISSSYIFQTNNFVIHGFPAISSMLKCNVKYGPPLSLFEWEIKIAISPPLQKNMYSIDSVGIVLLFPLRFLSEKFRDRIK